MLDFFSIMGPTLLACVILTAMHAYLGFHVLERKVIFADLSLAQVAALGAVCSLLFGHELHSRETYWFSLLATFIAAGVLALTRSRKDKIPQEAVIGILYAVSSSAALLLLSRTAEGDEHIRHMLVGNILLVTPEDILHMAILYTGIGLFHWKFRKIFSLISECPDQAVQHNLSVRKWDLLFYFSLALVVTSSVETAGVLLVFSFLIVPPVAASILGGTKTQKLFIAWGLGILASCIGSLLSYSGNYPTGASIVCAFGTLTVIISLGSKVTRAKQPFHKTPQKKAGQHPF